MDEKNRKAVEIYDKIAEDYSKNYDAVDSEEDLIFLTSFTSHLESGAYIVDIGCGTGFSAGWFVKCGFKTEGTDFSSSMIAIAKRNYPDIHFTLADMREFTSSQRVDAVWAGYSLFHFSQEDFEKTIENIKTYLKPGGIFGLVMQEGVGEVEIPEPFLPSETIYLHLYTENHLRKILEMHGFEVIDQKRKKSKHANEFAFSKLLLIGKLKN